METVKLTVSGLKADVENGLTRAEIAEKYNLPVVQIKKAMDMAGLKNAKPKSKPMFELVFDTATEIVAEPSDENSNEQDLIEAQEKTEVSFEN
jgi:hypothetical protein